MAGVNAIGSGSYCYEETSALALVKTHNGMIDELL